MAKYSKKPVVIDAIQWRSKEMLLKEVLDFFGGLNAVNAKSIGKKLGGKLVISTLEGDMTADDGDYIIMGVKGELYPCKPDIFEATYELVEGDTAGVVFQGITGVRFSDVDFRKLNKEIHDEAEKVWNQKVSRDFKGP